jgi:hypothetical protein
MGAGVGVESGMKETAFGLGKDIADMSFGRSSIARTLALARLRRDD